jgi:glycine/D-amino acid oxidase-like deaminating enzyme
MLESECNRVRILTNVAVERISHGPDFVVAAAQDEFRAKTLVVATGGLSIPKMGPFQHRHAPSALPCPDGAHQASRTATENDHVEVVSQASPESGVLEWMSIFDSSC